MQSAQSFYRSMLLMLTRDLGASLGLVCEWETEVNTWTFNFRMPSPVCHADRACLSTPFNFDIHCQLIMKDYCARGRSTTR